MQMGPRRPTGSAHRTDGLRLLYRLPLAHIDAAQVCVDRHMLVAVFDKHNVAKAVLHARKLHHAIADGAHCRTGRRSKIGAQVGTPRLQDGVHAHLETTGHPGKFDRRGEVRAAHALAVQRVVGPFGGTGLLEPDGFMGFAVVDELGAQYAAIAQRFTVGFQGFVDYGETITLAQCTAKVDVPGKQFGDLHSHRVGYVGRIGGGKQRALNDAACQAAAAGQFGGLDA